MSSTEDEDVSADEIELLDPEMSDQVSLRPLSMRERAALLWVIGALGADDVERALYEQTNVLQAIGDSPTRVNFVLPPDTPRTTLPDGPLPVRPIVVAPNGKPVGALSVWVHDGRLSSLD